MATYTFELLPYQWDRYRNWPSYYCDSVTFDGKKYRPGQLFATDDPCEFLRFMAAALQQLEGKAAGYSVWPGPGHWEAIEAECADEQAKAAAAKNGHSP